MTHARHMPFYLAVLAAAVVFAIVYPVDHGLAVILGPNSLFVVYLTLTLSRVGRLNGSYLRKHPAGDDVPVLLIFLMAAAAAAAAMASLFIVVNGSGRPDHLRLTLALTAVPLGWATIHTMAALHYAHLYWQPAGPDRQPRRGLRFPGDDEPDGWDFFYFAFVIGMTSQTSDVDITGRHIRRVNQLHAIASFFFNTVLLAAAVNVAVSLGS